ncbi:hypothetical protein EAO70_35700, partial [Streptomyces sp. adm13(2018)]
MSDDFSTEDIAAMRREGDLSSFLREQLRAGRDRTFDAERPGALHCRGSLFAAGDLLADTVEAVFLFEARQDLRVEAA